MAGSTGRSNGAGPGTVNGTGAGLDRSSQQRTAFSLAGRPRLNRSPQSGVGLAGAKEIEARFSGQRKREEHIKPEPRGWKSNKRTLTAQPCCVGPAQRGMGATPERDLTRSVRLEGDQKHQMLQQISSCGIYAANWRAKKHASTTLWGALGSRRKVDGNWPASQLLSRSSALERKSFFPSFGEEANEWKGFISSTITIFICS